MRRILIGVCAALLVVGAWSVPASATTEHCPEHNGHPAKDQSGADDNDKVLPAGWTVCVKAGPYATGYVVTDGVSTLKDYVEDAGIRVGAKGENVPDVSYWIVYDEGEEKPKPCPFDPELEIDDPGCRGECIGEGCDPEEPEVPEEPEIGTPLVIERAATPVVLAPTFTG